MKVKTVEVRNPHFRKGTFTELKEVIFDFMMPGEKTAALGDMICWMSSIKFVAERYNYVIGHLIVPPFFMEVAQNLMREYPHWRIHTKIPDRLGKGTMLQQPHVNPVNATMMHLIDLGAIYFAGTDRLPDEFNFYSELDLDDTDFEWDMPTKYVVMTPGATARTRTMLPSVYNAICDHLISKGVTPVHLGRTEMDHRVGFSIHEKYDLTKGINLIDKTSLLEAALIISDSQMVLGIDNGLLHLAALTDATILYGFTMAGPKQRGIRRKHGHTVELYPDEDKLPCRFCQEHVRFFYLHNFENCVYKENEPACVKMLNAESWIATIDMVLGEKDGGTEKTVSASDGSR